MSSSNIKLEEQRKAVQRAFTKQSTRFDAEDSSNLVLSVWRKIIYRHVEKFIRTGDSMLELNAGTGIDALYFAKKGIRVLATDLSTGMVSAIQKKIESHHMESRMKVVQCSFDALQIAPSQKFNYVFSNFGGLNCSHDLRGVAKQLPDLLEPGAHVTWVIMPPLCPWEWLWLLKGKREQAFRRLAQGGSKAHLEGEFFTTYYYTLDQLKKALGDSFKLKKIQGLGIFSPPPSATTFVSDHPQLSAMLQQADRVIDSVFPFNRVGDHSIATFQFLQE